MLEQSTRKQHDYLVGLARTKNLTIPTRAETEHMSTADVDRALQSLRRGLDYFGVKRSPTMPFGNLL